MSDVDWIYIKGAITGLILVIYGFMATLVHKYEQDRYEFVCIGGPIWYKHYTASAYSIPINASRDVNPPRSEWIYCVGGDHGSYCLAGTILMGASILAFRFFQFVITRYVKYVHAITHIVSAVLICQGIRIVYAHETRARLGGFYDHRVIAYFAGAVYVGQISSGFLGFIYGIADCKIRQLFACFHDMFGSWVFLCMVGCCMSGIRIARVEYSDTALNLFNLYASLCFIIIPCAVYSPALEWELIGPI